MTQTTVLTLTKTHFDQASKEGWFMSAEEALTGSLLPRPAYRDLPEVTNRIDLHYKGEADSDLLRMGDHLAALGIAFDLQLPGDNHNEPETVYNRYGPTGAHEWKRMPTNGHNPPMDECITRIEDSDALRQFVLDHQAATTLQPWKHQIEYGKRYRARELLKVQ